MRKILKNKKGFTLVELLAVIVVLAIIILVAMPNVMSAMDKARRNALITEASEIVKIAQTAYADKIMENKIKGNTTYCFSLEKLKNQGYLDKNIKDYKGSVLLEFNPTTNAVSYKIFLDNSMYEIFGKDSSTLTNEVGAGKTMQTSTKNAKTNNCNDQGEEMPD